MFKKNNKVKIQTHLSPVVGDIVSSPWEVSSMLKPMVAPQWFKTMNAHAKVDADPEMPSSSPLIQEGNLSTGIAGMCKTLRTCPSFINLLTTGYVIHNKMDVVIRYQNGEVQLRTFTNPEMDVVSTHSIDQFTKQFPFEDGFSKFSLKFLNQWFLRSDIDVTLLILPCWWDSIYNNVRAIHGLVKMPANFDWSPHINTTIRLPREGEEYLIPADAPIAHVIPVNLANVSVTHNQELQGDVISKKTKAMFTHVNSYSPISDKMKNIGRMFRLNSKGK